MSHEYEDNHDNHDRKEPDHEANAATALMNEHDKESTDFIIDPAKHTRRFCILGLVLSYIVGLGAFITGFFSPGRSKDFELTPVTLAILPLAFDFVVLLVTETVGYIHSVSLRWQLLREKRLEFNTNLRLLTFSREQGWKSPNSMVMNVLYLFALTLSYAAPSLFLVRNQQSYDNSKGDVDLISFTQYPVGAFGVAILVQCGLATWALWVVRVPSYSSNPFNTLAVMLKDGDMRRQPGRCMLSVQDQRQADRDHEGEVPKQARAHQEKFLTASVWVRYILLTMVAILVAYVCWTAVMIPLTLTKGVGSNWNFVATDVYDDTDEPGSAASSERPTSLTYFLTFFAQEDYNSEDGSLITTGGRLVREPMTLALLLFTAIIQSFITLGMHCAELLVNMIRDERSWQKLRQLSKRRNEYSLAAGIRSAEKKDKPNPPGLPLTSAWYNSLLKPVTGPESLFLFLSKPVIHWVYGQTIGMNYGSGIFMHAPQIMYLTILWAIFVAVMVLMALRYSRGPLPSSYGHFQTMADVMDEWRNVVFWGEKTAEGSAGVRHAGTSMKPLAKVVVGEYYS